VIYSSTALIGTLESSEPFNDEKVRRFRREFDLEDAAMSQLLLRCRGKRMVVVGDYIADRYHFCDASGIASEGPMMTLRPLGSNHYDGAAAIIARHLAGLGADVTLITALANDPASEQVIERLSAEGIHVRAARQRQQLVTKTRYLVDQTKLFKVDEGAVAPLDSRSLETVAGIIEESTTEAAGIIFADFGYGTITGPLLDRVLPKVRANVPIVTADVSGRQSTLLRFREVDLMCPTEREIRQTLNNFSSGLNAVVYELLERTKARAAMITLGKQGLCLFDDRKQVLPTQAWDRTLRTAYLPALSGNVIDPLGCGDALLATASLVLAAGGSTQAAAFLGSLAAGIEVQRVGNEPITTDQLLVLLNRSTHQLPARLAS
jgi:rfaE bifunctional protein kinase chain/domain